MRQTLLSLLDDCASRAEETAIVHWRGLRISRWSYGRLAAAAYQFARELESRNIGKGACILLWAENSPEWVVAFFGCLLRGAVAVPLDKLSAPDFVLRVQRHVAAKLLLHSNAVRPEAGLNLPSLRLDELSEVIAHHSSSPYSVENISGNDLVEIIFTSGTTAEPKGVCLTHRNFLASLAPLEEEIGRRRRWARIFHPLRFLNLLPLSHVFGQYMGMFVPQLLGGEVYFREALNPSEIIETVRKQRIMVIAAFPRLLDTLRERVERDYAARGKTESFKRSLVAAAGKHVLRRWWTFSRVHRLFGWKFWAFISGGATLSEETENFWRALGFAVIQGYGMTETASIISLPNPFDLTPGSIGRALPGQEVKLDEQGEILVRGENVSPGYWRGELQPFTDQAGWLHTGDIGAQDRDGNIYFRGRRKDVIVTAAGMKIHPEDLEAALDRQPEIRASAVVSVEGPRGPEPAAALILRDAQANAEDAVRRANEMLAKHQQIRRWIIWPESDFPRTATTQKVIRRLVAEVARQSLESEGRQKAGRAAIRPSSFILQQIARISGQVSEQVPATANLTTDLKLDSLGRIELLSALEDRYQVELDEAAFTAATTLSDIEKMIQEGAPETVSYPYPEWPQHFPVTWIRFAALYLLILPLTRMLCPLRVLGRDHLSELSGPALIVANHITAIDPALILSALPWQWRNRLAIAMLGEYLREWLHPPAGTGWLKRLRWRAQYVLVVALFNVFSLPQQSGFRRSFAFAGETMDRGYNVLLFPEGQRTPDGRMYPFLAGAGLLVEKLNVPVIPVRIDGLFALKQNRRYHARPGEVMVTFGAPVRFPPGAPPVQITKTLERRIAAL